MKHAHGGIYENELEAYFDFVLKMNQCEHSFSSIIAGGKKCDHSALRRQQPESKRSLFGAM